MFIQDGDNFISTYKNYTILLEKIKSSKYLIKIKQEEKPIYNGAKSENAVQKHKEEIEKDLINLIDRYEQLLVLLKSNNFTHTGQNKYVIECTLNKNGAKCTLTLRVPKNARKREQINDHFKKLYIQASFQNEVYFNKNHQFPVYWEDLTNLEIKKMMHKYIEYQIHTKGL